MKLLLAELYSSLYQELTTGAGVRQVYAVRPHVYRHGFPAGNVVLQVQDSLGNVVAASASRAIASLGAGTYWHGYAQFLVSAQLQPGMAYRFALVASSYTFAEAAYLAWVNGFDLSKYSADYTPAVGLSAPLDLEVWTRQQPRKGVA